MQLLLQETVYCGKIISLEKLHFEDTGVKRVYEVIRHPGGASVLPVFKEDNILLVSQFRVAIQAYTWEAPAGLLEKGEDPKACSLRELQEEAGYAAKKILSFGKMLSSPGILNEEIHLFVATELYPSHKPCDEDEKIEKRIFPLEEAIKMCHNGKILDAKTALLLFKYAMWRKSQSWQEN